MASINFNLNGERFVRITVKGTTRFNARWRIAKLLMMFAMWIANADLELDVQRRG